MCFITHVLKTFTCKIDIYYSTERKLYNVVITYITCSQLMSLSEKILKVKCVFNTLGKN